MALRKHQRIRSARQVAAVFSGARPVSAAGMAVRVLRRSSGGTTFAVTVPVSAVPTAVRRNTIRRRVTECLRKALKGGSAVGHARITVTVRREMTTKDIDGILVPLLVKSGILQQ